MRESCNFLSSLHDLSLVMFVWTGMQGTLVRIIIWGRRYDLLCPHSPGCFSERAASMIFWGHCYGRVLGSSAEFRCSRFLLTGGQSGWRNLGSPGDKWHGYWLNSRKVARIYSGGVDHQTGHDFRYIARFQARNICQVVGHHEMAWAFQRESESNNILTDKPGVKVLPTVLRRWASYQTQV